MLDDQPKESLVQAERDPLMRGLNKAVIISVKILAILMVLVIWLALADVIVHLASQIMAAPLTLFRVESLISILGDFLAVLIAIEVFLNIAFYLKKDAIHVPLVLATALTAVARKVIILDYTIEQPDYLYATAAIIFATGLTYWLVTKKANLQVPEEKEIYRS